MQGAEASDDELECVLVHLVQQGYLQAYLSHEKKVLVARKEDAFPSLAQVRAQ